MLRSFVDNDVRGYWSWSVGVGSLCLCGWVVVVVVRSGWWLGAGCVLGGRGTSLWRDVVTAIIYEFPRYVSDYKWILEKTYLQVPLWAGQSVLR